MKPEPNAGLRFIAPLEVTMPIDGRDVTISPLVLKELPKFLELMLPVYAVLPQAGIDFFNRMADGKLDDSEVSQLITAFTVGGTDMIALLAFCSRQPAEWVGGLLIDRATELLAVSMQVNVDFFRRALPNLRAMAARLDLPASAAPEPAPTASTTPTPSNS